MTAFELLSQRCQGVNETVHRDAATLVLLFELFLVSHTKRLATFLVRDLVKPESVPVLQLTYSVRVHLPRPDYGDQEQANQGTDTRALFVVQSTLGVGSLIIQHAR